MPIIVGTMKYPSHMQGEVAKKWLKIRDKYPPNESIAEQLCAPVTTTDNGIVVMGIYKVKPGKLDEAFTLYSSFFYEFIFIEGYEYTVKVWSTFEEAINIAGIEVPE